MSGFDFDALRDPLAPEPGSRERALVEARARQLRARNRRTRIVLSATSLVAVVAILAGVVAVTHKPGPTVTVENPSTTLPPTTTPTTAGPSIDGRFIPPTSLDKNGFVKMPVTFPDGETTTLHYPGGMQIAQLGFTGGVGVGYPVTSGALRCCGKVVSIRYTTIQHLYGDAKPIKIYRGANGEAVPFFHGYQSVPPVTAQLDYLVFQFGPWLVQVYDVQHSGDFELRMTDAQRAMWARSLTGTVDSNGYLLLHAQAPLSIDNALESGFGADPGNRVELDPHLYCDEPGADTGAHRQVSNDRGHGVSWCVGKDLHVSASGTARFADLATDLQVDPLESPATSTPTSTTTTTTTPRLPPAPAVSASFVSTQQGWVLEQNGAVLGTTDGGATWKALGSAGPIGENYNNPQIRFADAKRGFIHTDRGLSTTDDGGARWQRLATPFGRVSDLAISHGVVYLIAVGQDGVQFRIWSSPAGRLAWTEDPLVMLPGAGPVPVQQLVFSGSNGWVTNGDRGLMGGAQLSADGHWKSWKPPCIGAYASLAASSATDMAALCEEGVFTGPKITNRVYFSHDGGRTFTRHGAPGFGSVASASAHDAVILNGNTLQRTTDEGTTWKVVYTSPIQSGASSLDLGFTTPTQGFAIILDGAMLMTHDAGATWTQVTLP